MNEPLRRLFFRVRGQKAKQILSKVMSAVIPKGARIGSVIKRYCLRIEGTHCDTEQELSLTVTHIFDTEKILLM